MTICISAKDRDYGCKSEMCCAECVDVNCVERCLVCEYASKHGCGCAWEDEESEVKAE